MTTNTLEIEFTAYAMEGFFSRMPFADNINNYGGSIIQAFLKSEVFKKITGGKKWEDLSKEEITKLSPDLNLSLAIFTEGWQALRDGQDPSIKYFLEQINTIRQAKGENSIPFRLCKALSLGLDGLGNGTIEELDAWDGNYKNNKGE